MQLEGQVMVDGPRRPFGGTRHPRLPMSVRLMALVGLLLALVSQVPAGEDPRATPPPPAPSVPAPPVVTVPGTVGAPVPTPFIFNGGTAVAVPAARFKFRISPLASLKDLLPPAPARPGAVAVVDDLTKVPEILFQAPPTKEVVGPEAMKRTAHTIAKINHLNAKKPDGFLKTLVGERPDLAGLPLTMGDACRSKGERTRQFTQAANTVRRALLASANPPPTIVPQLGVTAGVPQPAATAVPPAPIPPPVTESKKLEGKDKEDPKDEKPEVSEAAVDVLALGADALVQVAPPARPNADRFWQIFRSNCEEQDKATSRIDRACREHATLARIAALTQILAAESPDMRLGLVKYLSAVSHVEATRALAKMAIFSSEDAIREAALDALKVRRERDYTEILVKGLRYPWPAVAKQTAEAIVKLERNDLVPQLVSVLEEPDPRAPKMETVDRKRVPMVQELVRLNHHKSCLLCHAPGNTGKVSADTITAEVPSPNDPLPQDNEGYRNSMPDILVRVDVTYLRSDFSMLQAVADAAPWPEMQRFDFVVRKRSLTDEEATAAREKLEKRKPGELSPYRRAALTALRELTGKDTEPTAEAWKKLLDRSGETE
jgi:hypothetical protein